MTAELDKRPGNRAAGELAALPNVLGDDDAGLIELLPKQEPGVGHPVLAAQRDAVEGRTDELHRATLRRRRATN